MDSIGVSLFKIRMQLGMTQEQVAKQCMVSVSTINKVENCTIDPKYSTLVQIARGLGCRLEMILILD